MKKISVEQNSKGFILLQDGKMLFTPLGKEMVLPSAEMAETLAGEWFAQGEKPRRDKMPLTCIACVAIDIVREQRDGVLDDILSYTDTDLVCYRAGDTPELAAIQQQAFEPLLQWLKPKLGIELLITDGVMPIKQPTDTRQKYAAALKEYDEWHLAVLACILKAISSLAIAFALLERRIDAKQAFHLSHLEEEFETSKWGKDDEKEERLIRLRLEIIAAGEFLKLLA